MLGDKSKYAKFQLDGIRGSGSISTLNICGHGATKLI